MRSGAAKVDETDAIFMIGAWAAFAEAQKCGRRGVNPERPVAAVASDDANDTDGVPRPAAPERSAVIALVEVSSPWVAVSGSIRAGSPTMT